jgi:hypothetical protein
LCFPSAKNGKEDMANELGNNQTNGRICAVNTPEFPLLATTKALASRYQVSPRCIQNWVSRRILPVMKIGRAVRFNVLACDKALAKFERKAVAQ